MTLTELRYALSVASERHFGRAALACNVSQPSLSVAIRKLEEELGIRIFERRNGNVTPTAVGATIIEQAQRVIEESERLTELAAQGKDPLNGPLRLGVIFTIAPYLLPGMIGAIHTNAPNMPMILSEDLTENLLEQLRRGTIDCAILAMPITAPGLMIQPLYDENFVAAVPVDHPLAKKSSLSRRDLKKEPMLLLGNGHCFRDQVLDFCSDMLRSSDNQKHTVESTSLLTIAHMVAQGVGITVLPASSVPYFKTNPLIKILPFEKGETPRRRVALVWRRSYPRVQAIDVITKSTTTLKIEGCHMLTGLPPVSA